MYPLLRHRAELLLRALTSALLVATYAASLTLASGGCVDPPTCVRLGCPHGQLCDEASGQCQAPVRDCTITGCEAGEVCDEASLRCRPQAVQCREGTCLPGQQCDSQTGFCQPRECDEALCRSQNQVCNEERDACVARDCQSDLDCAAADLAGTICAGGFCVAGCRPSQPSCPREVSRCVATGNEEVPGQCVEPCRTDGDCPAGTYCAQGACLPEPPCSKDIDCRSGEVCLQGKCSQAPCEGDEDCREGQACDRASGLCVAGDCAEDVFHPNHEEDTAARLQENRYTGLSSCAGRPDFYRVSLRALEALELVLGHERGADLDVYVWDTGGRLLALNQQSGPVSELEALSLEAQDVIVEVRPVSLEDVLYDLRVNLAPRSCDDDGYEDNDTATSAYVLAAPVGARQELPLALCRGDEDWFRLRQLPADRGLWVSLQGAPANLALDVLVPGGLRRTLRGATAEPVELLRLGSSGDVLLHARAVGRLPGSGASDYRLQLEVLGPMSCPSAGLHTMPSQAMGSLEPELPHNLMLCPLPGGAWEVDWLRLDPPTTASRLRVTLVPSNSELPPLSVAVAEQVGDDEVQLLRSAAAVGGGKLELTLPVEAGADLLLRVGTDAPVGALRQAPGYDLIYRYD